MKIFNKVSTIIASGLMVFFSVPKLLGFEESIKGFEQFKSLVPLDPNIFRMFTGIVELSIALLLGAYAIKNTANLGKAVYFLLLSTMIGALSMEFFARPQPEIMLVIIAIILATLSVFRLKTFFNK